MYNLPPERLSYVEIKGNDQLEHWHNAVSRDRKFPSYVLDLRWDVPGKGFHHIDLDGSLPPFTNLQYLWISNLSLDLFDDAAIKRIFGPLGHSLQTLCIYSLSTDPEKLALLISLLPHLQCLAPASVSMSEQLAPGGNNTPSFTFTGRIKCDARISIPFLHWVARSRLCLRGFTVCGIDDKVIEPLNLVVKSCSATLATMDLLTGIQDAEVLEPVDLSPCSNLQTLQIRPTPTSPVTLRTILNRISSKHFEKLTVGIATRTLLELSEEYDQVFCSFAKRLHELGAARQLTIMAGCAWTEVDPGKLDFRTIFPLFHELGGAVQLDAQDGWRP